VALGLDPLEGNRAVVDPVAHVVDPLAALLHPLRDRRVVAGRREELHVGVGDPEEGLLDSVALHGLTVLDLHAVGGLVVGDGGVEVPHRDGDVVDLGQHGLGGHGGLLRTERDGTGRDGISRRGGGTG
jgi:hypothetical protein